MKKILICTMLSMLSFSAFSASGGREVTIERFHPISQVRSDTNGVSITRVYVNNAAWGETDCRKDAADLVNDDDHIASILLTA